MTIVSIGEILWDVFADSERLGGAPFNFSAHAARLGHNVVFVSAVGDDDRGHSAIARAGELGVNTEFLRTVSAPTGMVTVRVDSAGQPDFTIHRPAAYDAVSLSQADLDRLAELQPDWLYYGTLYQSRPEGRRLVQQIADALPGARRFYDVNLRRDSYTPQLVAELMASSHVVKLNDDEASILGARGALPEATEAWSREFGWNAVAVTRGSRGCAIRIGADYAESPATPVQVVDTVGAGDAFAAAFLHGLSEGWDARRCGDFANRVGAEVAGRQGAI